ncbi:YHYH protein [Gilvimarinus sp. SDUM040013]|uniref:YHYH protein n=1 Tax=Gilvimarinus gilvus TaxID=3058038 RepID=A0ABU4S262_9GAMM|nr:YHYH protein [Gilvimarinus sp. SDUM040013]MDO3387431.1 YHYH protein [Gilvimarinus sp. SDUM040013]MDX6849908.1 YHYH protein [Gilvimarinus sp. SDUM040013]
MTEPGSIELSPSNVTIEYGSPAALAVSVSNGTLESVSCDDGIEYHEEGSVLANGGLGSFICTANAVDNDQNPLTATANIQVVDTTEPSISAPGSLALTQNVSRELSIAVVDLLDGNIVTFDVGCPAGISYAQGAITATAAGTFACTISASDTSGNVANTQVALAVTATVSSEPPVANAGDDVNTPTGSTVTLDASASTDADSDITGYEWSIIEQPSGSNASIANANSTTTEFTPDVDGDYTIRVRVSDAGNNDDDDELIVTASTATWILNPSSSMGENIDAIVNVTDVSDVTVNQTNFKQISTSGIPDYLFVITQEQVDALNSRPKASDDFIGGATSARAGDLIAFGDDLGYDTRSGPGCDLGYWPPGPACPSDQQRSANIPAQPSPASADDSCNTGLNSIGLMLNGTSVYNWSDGVSYQGQGTWNQLAPEFEIYDVDICSGHAQTEGDYHHHMFSSCLADLFSDEGKAHSPIYGYAADGYPIYGPYQGAGELAKPGWVKRDYNDISKGGCGSGTRSCLMVDQLDPAQGTTPLSSNGPDTDQVVSSNSGNEFIVASGYYYEDYYYDASLTQQGGVYLDEHNGHDHDGLGYHYHTTVEEGTDGALIPIFPYNVGPTFYGETPGGSIYTCQRGSR